jgi:hypothetical protein
MSLPLPITDNGSPVIFDSDGNEIDAEENLSE